MSETQPQMNEPTARTETGEIIDQAKPDQSNTNTNQETKTETKDGSNTETKVEPKIEAKTEAKTAAPEKYADFKLPEGIKLDGDQLTKATEIFKAQGLSQEGAQALVDFHVAQLKAATDGPANAFREMTDGWKAAQKTDPDIGDKADAIQKTVGKALATLENPKLVGEFQEAMNLTGVGDHPAFIKVLNALASRVVEGTPVKPGGPSENGQQAPGTKPKSVANAMYPNLA